MLSVLYPNAKKVTEFKTGQGFGEIALMTNSKR